MQDDPKENVPPPPTTNSNDTATPTDHASDTQDDLLEGDAEALRAMIDTNLRAFRGQFSRLSRIITEQTEALDQQAPLASDLKSSIKQLDSTLLLSIQQETKIHDKIETRVGRAGKYAFDVAAAHAEIGRRLTGLRRAGGSSDIHGGDT